LTTKILLAPAAGGKTRYCIQRILDVLEGHPLGPVWVIVPDRLQAYAFRGRISAAGGAIGVHAVTFGDLYRQILWDADQPIPVTSDPMTQRILQDSIRRVEGMAYFAPISDMPGFHKLLAGTINELKLARVWPDDFLEWTESQPDGLAEIAQVYRAYQANLVDIGWADSAGVSWLATESLEGDRSPVQDWPLIVVDGFDSFNGSQRAALRILGQQSQELLITLPGQGAMDRVAHRRFRYALESLEVELAAEIKFLPQEETLPPALVHLEQNLFVPEAKPNSTSDRLTMLEVRSPREEAREALRWLKSLIVRQGIQAHECAIVSPAPERYRAFLREAGLEFDMRLRFTHGESLASAPAIAALLDLLALSLTDYPRRLTLEAVRAPYFDLNRVGLSREDADRLDRVSRQGLVIQGLDQWEGALTRLALLDLSAEGDHSENTYGFEVVSGEAADSLWRGLQAFAERLTMPAEGIIQSYVSWLEDLLDDLRFLKEGQTPGDEAAFLGLRGVLRALVLGESVAGEKKTTPMAFFRMLRSFLEGANYQEPVKWTESVVLVLRVLEARGLRYKAVAVLGLSEGLFPEVEREDPFLREEMREALDLENRLEREQGGLFYQAATRADEHLLLTRPTLADDGEHWEPSPFWIAVRALYEDEPRLLRLGEPRAMADAASMEEALFWAVRRKALPGTYSEDLIERWEYLRRVSPLLHARLEKKAGGPFDGILDGLADQLNLRYGHEHVWSPSRFEAYGSCPHRFLIGSTLELEPIEPPGLGVDARQLGSMLHEILEDAYLSATDPTDSAQVLDALGEVSEEIFTEAPDRYGFRPTALWEVEQDQFRAALEESVEGLDQEGEGWAPIAFERAFGMLGEPALQMKIDGKRILVRGLIDRLDQRANGQIRVIDYKTGFSHLHSRDLIMGQRLQLPIYALAARDALGLGDPVDGFYWAILRAEAGNLRLGKFRYEALGDSYEGPTGAIDLALKHIHRIVTGVRGGQFPPIPPQDGCPEFCPAAAWCWRYTPKRW
jgi:ATP-dependent helicase/DNAse subunit B